MSEWFKGTPEIAQLEVIPIQESWICPQEGCDGEMKANGMVWPTADPGYHHTCDKCGYTAAIKGVQYPRIVYKRREWTAEWEANT